MKVFFRAREMVKSLPMYSHKMLGTAAACPCNPRTGEVQTGGPLSIVGVTVLAKLVTPGSGRDFVSETKVGVTEEDN